MGGKFFLIALCPATVYVAQHSHLPIHDLLKRTLLVVLAVFAFSLVGKFMGIGIARIRFGLVWRQLDGLLQHARMTHVSMHEGG